MSISAFNTAGKNLGAAGELYATELSSRVGKGAVAPCPRASRMMKDVGTLRFAHPTSAPSYSAARAALAPNMRVGVANPQDEPSVTLT